METLSVRQEVFDATRSFWYNVTISPWLDTLWGIYLHYLGIYRIFLMLWVQRSVSIDSIWTMLKVKRYTYLNYLRHLRFTFLQANKWDFLLYFFNVYYMSHSFILSLLHLKGKESIKKNHKCEWSLDVQRYQQNLFFH